MVPFFSDKAAADRLRDEVLSWCGTPYRHWCGVKGLGADCIHFVVRIGEAVGFIPRGIRIPEYSQRWHFHQDDSLLINHFDKAIKAGRISADDVTAQPVMIGDVVFFHFGRTVSHSAVYCDGYLYHAVTGPGVIKTCWTDAGFQKRLKRVYRFLV
jgi:cell wall-associated NlpC family hydrolase